MQLTPERWAQARLLFDELVDLAPVERDRRLIEAGGGDLELRNALQTLVKSHDALTGNQDDPLALEIDHTVSRLWPAASAGQRFGAFEVIREIGRGGMGIVYLAERCDGAVEQRAALKILAQIHDEASIARLNRERQLLADLEHPHIARLIDAGENADGVPYFAMEYIDGISLLRYCDENLLSVEDRLVLFAAVCAAVQYAHSQLVVHGDLKSGNVLVTADGVPKLLDFGIAVSLRRQVDSGPEHRDRPVQRFFSASAAAPELLAGGASSIASDVYALGALLCELLCGKKPFDLSALSNAEIAAALLERQPRLPSEGISPGSAERRNSSAAGLRRRLRGDLDAIVAKALSKRPQDRYESVELLRLELDRHRALKPVIARRDERGYRGRRFVKRNLATLSVSALLAALLIGFLGYALLQNQRLAAERDSAQRQQIQTRFERDRAERVTSFLIDLFRAADPAQLVEKDISARQLLARGTQRLESDLSEQPLIRAAILAAIADIYIELDDLESAVNAADEALRLRENAQPVDSAALAASLRQRARLASLLGEHDQSLQLIDAAIAQAGEATITEQVEMQSMRARALSGNGQSREAIKVWEQALQLATRSPVADPSLVLRTVAGLTYALRSAGELPRAEQVIREHLSTSPQPAGAVIDTLDAELRLQLAVFARNKGNLNEADKLARATLNRYREIYGIDSSYVAQASNILGTIAQARGDYAESRALFELVLSNKKTVYGADNVRVSGAEYNLGLLLLLRLNSPLEAETHLRRAVAIGQANLPPTHSSLANYRLGLGSALRDLGHHDEARQTLRLALNAFRKIAAPRGIDVAISQGEIACSELSEDGRGAATIGELEQAVTLLQEQASTNPQAQRVFRCADDVQAKSP